MSFGSPNLSSLTKLGLGPVKEAILVVKNDNDIEGDAFSKDGKRKKKKGGRSSCR